MALLSTAAWVAHDLGLATGVGGSLFGKMALEPSVRNIADNEERGRVVNDAWRRFGAVQLGALGVMAATWFVGRMSLSGREVSSSSRGLVLAKDLLVGATFASAVGAAVAGKKLSKERENGAIPMNDMGEVSTEASPQARSLGRVTDSFGLVNLLTGAGVVAVTAILAMKAGKSGRWSAISRLLP